MAEKSLVTPEALSGVLSELRDIFSTLGNGGGGDSHKSWGDGSMTPQNWDKMAVLDVYLSQVCVKHEPSTKTGAQMWFVGAGTYRKYTLADGQISTEYIDLQNLISKKADTPARFSTMSVENYNKAKLGDYYLGQVCVRDGSDGKHFVGPGTYRKYTLSADGKTVNTEYVDLNSSKADKPNTWQWVQGQSWSGIKAGDNVAGAPVVGVDNTYFYLLVSGGIEAYRISNGQQDSKVPGYFLTRQEVVALPKSYTEQEVTNKSVALSNIKIGDTINGFPVVVAYDSYVECSTGSSGFVRYIVEGTSIKIQLFTFANGTFLNYG